MLRKAQNMDFKSILEMEMAVSHNRMQDQEFKDGVEAVLMKRTQAQFNPIYASQEELDSYFSVPSEIAAQGSLPIVKDAMLPTRHYYESFPDHLRLYVNEQNSV
jgi:hypothetical protein